MNPYLRTIASCIGIVTICLAADNPVWELAKEGIPADQRQGRIEQADDGIVLRDGAAIAIPSTAFPDQRNFTVQVTATLLELVQDGVFTVMRKQTSADEGFTFSMNYRDQPAYARSVSTVVNNVLMSARAINHWKGPETNVPYTFTVAVRDGYASFYIDDELYTACYMEMVPSAEPLWIGRNADSRTRNIPVRIGSVKVFSAAYKYISSKVDPQAAQRGTVAGRGWMINVPKVEHPEWPKILIYGDSISCGYINPLIRDMGKQGVYVYHIVHFVGGDVPEKALSEVAKRFPYQAIVFNNGLHSLGWTQDKVSDDIVRDRMSKMARCFTQGAPQAKVFYLLTTPHTGPRPEPGKAVVTLGDLNDVVKRLNLLTDQVMASAGIPQIDVYEPLTRKLEWAIGDGYHWRGEAYEYIAAEVARRVLPSIGKTPNIKGD